VGEVTIARCLVTVGGQLIDVGRPLVLIRGGLIVAGVCLVAICARLIQIAVRSFVFRFLLTGDGDIPFPLTPDPVIRAQAP
jgi:hypothetical protein